MHVAGKQNQALRQKGEKIVSRIGGARLSWASLARDLQVSPALLRYHLFHVTRSELPRIAEVIRARAGDLWQIAAELDRLSTGTPDEQPSGT